MTASSSEGNDMITSAMRMITVLAHFGAVAGDEPEDRAEDRRQDDGAGCDRKGVLGGDDDAGQQWPAQRIGAEDEEPALLQREGRRIAAAQVLP